MAAPCRLIEHDSPHGHWRLWRAEAPAALRGLVIRIEGYEELRATPVLRREVPRSMVPLILDFGEGFDIGAPGGPLQRHSGGFLAGLHDRPVLVGSGGQARCMQVDFTPLGALRLAGAALGDLTNQVAGLRAVIGPGVAGLTDWLAGLPGWPARFAAVEDWLLRRFAATAGPPPWLGSSLAALEEAGGRLPVAALAARAGLDRRRFSAGFAAALGLPPRRLARLLRFDNAMDLLAAHPERPLSELALDAGYADQPHFTREVTALAGQPPGALRRNLLADGSGLMAG